jgi:CHAT domain-containing protein
MIIPCSIQLKVALILWVLIISIQHADAQTSKTVYATIVNIDSNSNPKRLLIQTPFSKQLKIWQTGTAITAHNSKRSESFDAQLGNVTVLYFNDSAAILSFISGPYGNKRGVRTGDLIKLDIIDTLLHPMDFSSHLLNYNLLIQTQYAEDLYNAEDLVKRYAKNTKETETWLLDTLWYDLKDFYEDYKENLTQSTFTTPLTSGRYKGKTVHDIFKSLSKEDVASFLSFLISYPGKYIGVPYKINETFATWLINNAPLGGYEVIRIFESVGGDSLAFSRKVQSVPGLLQEKKMAHSVALTAYNHLHYSENMVLRQLKAAEWFSHLSGDDEGRGLAYLYRAEIKQNNKQYEEAISYCQQSEAVYTKADNHDRLLDLWFKQSYIYYANSQYKQSIEVLQKVKPLLARKDLKIEDYTTDEALVKYYNNMAYTYNLQEQFIKADTYLDSALTIMNQNENHKNISTSANHFKIKGDIYRKQSLNDKALDAYTKSATLYGKLGDVKNASLMRVQKISIVLFRMRQYQESNILVFDNLALLENEKDYENLGFSYSQIGQNYWNLGLYDSAIASHNTAIAFRRMAGNEEGQAFSWEQLGTLYQQAGQKSKALLALDSAAILYNEAGLQKEMTEIYLKLGTVYINDKEDEKAEKYYRLAANTLATLQNKASYGDALFQLGLLVMNENPKDAYMYLDSARLLQVETGKMNDAAYTMMNLGSLVRSEGRFEEGKYWYKKALEIVETLNDTHAMGHYYRSLGMDAELDMQFDSSNIFYHKAMAIYDSTDKALALSMRSNIAGNYQRMGYYDKAESLYDEIITDAGKTGKLLELANAYASKSWMMLEQGKLNEGMENIDSAASNYQKSGNLNRLAFISDLRGEYNRKIFNFKESYKWYSVSDSIYAKSNNPWQHSSSMFNFIVLYYYQGDYQKSLDYTHRAISLRPFFLEDQTYITLHTALAEIYYYLGKTDSTGFYIDKYLTISKERKLLTSYTLLSLLKGRMLTDNQQYADAIPYLLPSATSESFKNSKNIYQQGLAYLGLAYSGAGQRDSAQYYLNLAAETARKFELPSFSWEALYLAGLDAYKQEQFEQAIQLFKQSVDLVNRQAANLYGGEEATKLFRQQPAKADLYGKLMSALSKAGRKDEAWQYANLAQAAALTDLSGGIVMEGASPEKQAAIREAQLKFQQVQSVSQALESSRINEVQKAGQIAILEKRKEIARTEYLNYINQLNRQYPELQTFFANQVNPENLRNLHRLLPEDMAMMMYVINEDELMIFWATRQSTGIVSGQIPADFYTTADNWLTALKNPQRPANAGPLVLRTKIGKVPSTSSLSMDVKTGANQLYNLLIQPLPEEIKNKKQWCIIPNGKLTHLPFHAMGTPNASGNFEYLAASHTIFYTNKPNELFLPKEEKKVKLFAAFGNPDLSLDNAGKEVNEIAKYYPNALVYTEGNATLARATKSLTEMDYVHFATHGVLSYPDFDSSYLVLAPEKGIEGKLTLYDIRSLDIQGCDLVTLSACETAVSANVGKGWYISPANAFLINQVRSVMASLWEVDDAGTRMLMERFYHHLQGYPKSEALRMAMADVSSHPDFEHPFYWAAFVLYGDWQ